MYKKLIYSLHLLLFINFKSNSQNVGHPGAAELKMPTVALPSPNASSLIRAVNENVDLYTGKLNVSIPLYTLKSRSVELPITLNGSASAHRVNDIASWVGLGWHLNAGGAITRVMNNLPDEFTGIISPTFNINGFGFTKIKSLLGIDLSNFPDANDTYYSASQKKDIINRGAWNVVNNIPDYGIDLHPDQFYFNFGKYSGRFVFDQDGNVQIISKSNLRITPFYEVINGNNKISSFVVVTEDGYRYEFGNFALNAVEETKITQTSKSLTLSYACLNPNNPGPEGYGYWTKPTLLCFLSGKNGPLVFPDFDHPINNSSSENCKYPSTWYLTKTVSPTGDVINLEYVDNGSLNYLTDRSFTASIIDFTRRRPPVVCPFPSGFSSDNLSGFPPVDLDYSSSKVQQKYYPSPLYFSVNYTYVQLSSKRIKKISTEQGYSVVFNASQPRLDLQGDKMLESIAIYSGTNLLKSFSFVYQNVYSDETLETFKFSYKKFNWNNGNSRFDDASELKQFEIDDNNRYRLFLKSIREIGGEFYLQQQLPPYEFFYDETKLPFRTSTQQDIFGFANNNNSKHPFHSVSYFDPHINPNFTNPCTGVITNTIPRDDQPIIFFQMTGPTGNSIQWPSPSHMGTKEYSFEQMKAGVLKKIILPTGGIKEYEYEVSANTNPAFRSWSGLRIKKLTERESATASAIETNYTYGNYIAFDKAFTNYSMPERQYSTDVYDKRVFFNSSRVNPQMLTKGAEGGYDFVEVKKQGNGKYRVDFTTEQNYPVVQASLNTRRVSTQLGQIPNLSMGDLHPFAAPDNFEWKHGLPLKETFTNENGNKVKEVFYEYDFDSWQANTNKVIGLSVSKYRFNAGQDFNAMLYRTSTFTSEWNALKSKTERVYASDGINYSEQKTTIQSNLATYEGRNYLMPSQITTTHTSKNEKVVQNFKYVIDYGSAIQSDPFGSGINFLKSKNMLNIPIEQTTRLETVGGNVIKYISGTLNEFHQGVPVLKRVYDLQPSATLTSLNHSSIVNGVFVYDPNFKSVINYNLYDGYGNIYDRNEEGDIRESYLWDYFQTYPVAKVVNAPITDIAYTSFESNGSGNFSPINTSAITNGGITGKKCYRIANATITREGLAAQKKYIVSVWSKNGTPVSTEFNGSSQIASSSFVSKITINGWTYYEKVITNATKTVISGSGSDLIIDELRIYPVNAQMTTYTFDPLVGMTSQCDMNNRIVNYEYDSFQRLVVIRDQYGNITKTFEYNYKDRGF